MRHARMSSRFGDWKLQKQAEGEGSEADLGGRGLYHGAPCGWPRRHPLRWLRRRRCSAAGLRPWRNFRTTDRCSRPASSETENNRSEVTS